MRMRVKAATNIHHLAVLGCIGGMLVSGMVWGQAADLEKGFLNPPDSAKPHTWWHWIDGNVTAEGITLDLEAMARVGVGGAQIFDVGLGIPTGPVAYMSDDFRALVRHAIQEAARLGLQICMHNTAGWSSSGGPWVKPEHAMQMLVTSEVRVKGPARFDAQLPQPETRAGYYRDIAVLAFPTPPAEIEDASANRPKVTASQPDCDAQLAMDGNPNTAAQLILRSRDAAEYLQLEFERPFTARALTVWPTWAGGQGGELEVSEDGTNFRKVADFRVPEPTILRYPACITFEPATGRFFRLTFRRGAGRGGLVRVAEATLEAGYRIRDWGQKAGYVRAGCPEPTTAQVPPEGVIPRGSIIDLTAHMDASGRLTWDVPEGDWTIIRFGHTPTGKDNHPARESGRGLECDKLSREAVKETFDAVVGRIADEVGPLAGSVFYSALIDSYEVDTQNWTPRFREEFRRLRGYDPLPYLPAMVGRIVDSLEVSERFLFDVRRTIADLFAENYYGYFAELLHERGMLLSAEPYGNGGFDDLTCGGRADIPMSEFWVGQGLDLTNAKLASSAAHTYGHRVVGAESFTADPSQGKWQNHPYKLKALGDFMWCGGVNRYIFHRYAHQPWRDLRPGMTMGPWGFHFERTNTWWEQGQAWLQYIARCQYLLQSGLFVADLCYLVGENSPTSPPGRGGLNPAPPLGYDYDVCSPEVILQRMSVKNGRLVLPDGMSYRVLVLPPSETMTPELLEKIRDLVRDGAVIVGPPPKRSPSLQGYPDCDRRVQTLAAEIWGECDGQKVTENRLGKGRVFWGRPLPEILPELGIQPDFEVIGQPRPDVNYIHRVAEGTDLYFVCCSSPRPVVVEASFRVGDRTPELWHPDSGEIEVAAMHRRDGGRTIVPLRFDPCGSVFVVFRKAAPRIDPVASLTRDGQPAGAPRRPAGLKLEITQAIYGVLSGRLPDAVDVTAELRAAVRDNRLSIRASNDIAGDPAPLIVKQLWVQYAVGDRIYTKTVTEGQLLEIPEPGQGEGPLEIRRAIYGVLPERPEELGRPGTVDVTDILRAKIVDDTLTVRADNSLAGDPAYLIVKQLRVDYTLNGEPYTKIVNENEMLTLPDGTEKPFAAQAAPVAELEVRDRGGLTLTAWEDGLYEARTASGKRLRARISGVPRPMEVSGPWQVSFPTGLGAPERATFDRLTSWTESEDPGIKYFSGTATYVKRINIPAALLGQGKVLALDLGSVEVIAEVRLNGRDLGILWKPPFRVDITSAAQPGENVLEIAVTNLWPNRLIGDEQYPPDAEYNPGGPIKAWPEWLVEGKPRPVPQRVAFTTWQHWTKDSPLLPSGLLGPVRLLSGRQVALAQR